MEAWWRHQEPPDAKLAVVTVRDGEDLVGLAPFFKIVGLAPFFALRRFGVREVGVLGGGLASRIGILAERDRESEVAALIAREERRELSTR